MYKKGNKNQINFGIPKQIDGKIIRNYKVSNSEKK